MGHGISIKCESCDYNEEFILGVGMMYSTLENVIDLVGPDIREKVLGLLHNQDIHSAGGSHELFVCPNCKILTEHFDFSITYNDNRTFRPLFICPECSSQLISVEGPITNLPCPKCGKKTLIEDATILWD